MSVWVHNGFTIGKAKVNWHKKCTTLQRYTFNCNQKVSYHTEQVLKFDGTVGILNENDITIACYTLLIADMDFPQKMWCNAFA